MQRDIKYNDFNAWISSHGEGLKAYFSNPIGHAEIDISHALGNIADSIKRGDAVAADIGFDLLAHDPVMPFGKIVKSKLLNALVSYRSQLGERKWAILENLHVKWTSMKPFPPREMRYLEKLLKKRAADKRTDSGSGA